MSWGAFILLELVKSISGLIILGVFFYICFLLWARWDKKSFKCRNKYCDKTTDFQGEDCLRCEKLRDWA